MGRRDPWVPGPHWADVELRRSVSESVQRGVDAYFMGLGPEPEDAADAPAPLPASVPEHWLERMIVIGGPKTGKSTLAEAIPNHAHRDTDSLLPMEWSEHSLAVAAWFDDPGPWVIEGTAVVRALRKWLRMNPEKRLEGVGVVLLWHSFEVLNPGQRRMATGVRTIWAEIEDEVWARGAHVQEGMP